MMSNMSVYKRKYPALLKDHATADGHLIILVLQNMECLKWKSSWKRQRKQKLKKESHPAYFIGWKIDINNSLH